MARGNPKPTDKLDWISDDTTNILEPLPSVKATGWLFGQKPPNTSFNFITNLINRLLDYAMGQVGDWIVIDSDADEGDYATLVAWEADAPAANDRILVKEDQVITAQFVLPDNVTIKFLDGARLLCATNIATSVLKLGSNPIIEGVLNIVLSQIGTTAKAVEIDGDNAVGKINIENSSTGTLTTGYHINGNKTGNRINGFAQNTGGGILTNIIVDNSTEESNSLIIVDESNNIVISTSFVDRASAQTINGIKTFSNEIIASGGIQTDGSNTLKTKVIDIGDWNMDSANSISKGHGLDYTKIRNVSVLIRDDADTTYYDFNYDDFNGSILKGVEVFSANVTLRRGFGGFFDSGDFNSTSFNRGWITITYIT